jgi:alpha-1,2-mannosyltransferase
MTDRKPWKTVQTFGALLGVSVAVLVFVFILISLFTDPPVMWDLDVYRGAVRSWLSGNGLYEFTSYGPGGEVLPFTYPPFAAILMAPLAVLPDGVVNLTWMAGTLVLCVALSVMLLRSAPGAGRRLTLRAVIVGVLASLALLVSEPVSHGASLGQVSLFLLLVSFADAGGFVPPKWRGWLVGVAGGMKLIPLVFVPYYLVTRQ